MSSFSTVPCLYLWWICKNRGGVEGRQPNRVPSSILLSVFILAPAIKYLTGPVCLLVAAHCETLLQFSCPSSALWLLSLHCFLWVVSWSDTSSDLTGINLIQICRFLLSSVPSCLLVPAHFPFHTFSLYLSCFCNILTPRLFVLSGMGDMAVSNSIGSNVFDILVGLGLPWALKTLAINYGSDVSCLFLWSIVPTLTKDIETNIW